LGTYYGGAAGPSDPEERQGEKSRAAGFSILVLRERKKRASQKIKEQREVNKKERSPREKGKAIEDAIDILSLKHHKGKEKEKRNGS